MPKCRVEIRIETVEPDQTRWSAAGVDVVELVGKRDPAAVAADADVDPESADPDRGGQLRNGRADSAAFGKRMQVRGHGGGGRGWRNW